MNSRCGFFLVIFLLCVTALLSARGGREKANVVQVTGVVRLVGSSLFSELVITGSEKEWYIAKEDRDKLQELQHRTVTVEGVETVIELKFASGLSAGQRRELRNIKVITVQE